MTLMIRAGVLVGGEGVHVRGGVEAGCPPSVQGCHGSYGKLALVQSLILKLP